MKQMGQMILTISLSTMNLTTDIIKDAFLSIQFMDVELWLNKVLLTRG